MKDTSVIPEGPYCYSLKTGDACEYWYRELNDHGEEVTRCSFLEFEDVEEGLLWDMVKECGINEGEEDED